MRALALLPLLLSAAPAFAEPVLQPPYTLPGQENWKPVRPAQVPFFTAEDPMAPRVCLRYGFVWPKGVRRAPRPDEKMGMGWECF